MAPNLTIYGGSDFSTTFNITNNANTAFDLTGYTGSGAISKSVPLEQLLGITLHLLLELQVLLAGKFDISLGSTATKKSWIKVDICMMF